MEWPLRNKVPPSAAEKDLLRFITCGSVDDGKSTLIGRLLHDTSLILDDHLAALVRTPIATVRRRATLISRFCSMVSKPSASKE